MRDFRRPAAIRIAVVITVLLASLICAVVGGVVWLDLRASQRDHDAQQREAARDKETLRRRKAAVMLLVTTRMDISRDVFETERALKNALHKHTQAQERYEDALADRRKLERMLQQLSAGSLSNNRDLQQAILGHTLDRTGPSDRDRIRTQVQRIPLPDARLRKAAREVERLKNRLATLRVSEASAREAENAALVELGRPP